MDRRENPVRIPKERNKNSSEVPLICMLTNADSLSNKTTELRSRIKTWKNNQTLLPSQKSNLINAGFILSNADYKIERYEAHTHNLDSGTGRGIIIYVKSKLNVLILNFTTDFTEHLGIQIRLANRELLTFACIYRSPNSTDENNEQLTALIHQLDQTNSAYKLLVGDFNYGAISWQDNTATSAAETAFLDCLQNTYLNQHVEEPTRGRSGQNPSILDFIISNDPNIVSHIRYESPLGKSDHACLVFNINCYKQEACRPIQPAPHSNYSVLQQMPARGC